MELIIGNIFGLLSNMFLGLSVHKKSYKKMFVFQVLDCICGIISCFVLNGVTGAVTTIIALLRNVIKIIEPKYEHVIQVVLIGLLILCGVLFF